MPRELSDRRSLFLHVRTHPQLQYYLNLSDTHVAANHSGLFRCWDREMKNVIEIHPVARLGASRHPR